MQKYQCGLLPCNLMNFFFFLFINKWVNNSELTSFPGGPTGPIIPTGPGGPYRKVININYSNNKY